LQDGVGAIREIHENQPDISAVICTSPIITMGVLSECRKLGISVPGRLSVTGFDDFNYASLVNPPVTALAVPSTEIGRLAAEALLGRLDQDRTIVPLELDPQLQIRSSTAPFNNGAVDS
jgi:LacI family transcriptional regulator